MTDKPPLLSEQEFMKCAGNIPVNTGAEKAAEPWIFGTKLIEVQRDADIKWFNQWLEEKVSVERIACQIFNDWNKDKKLEWEELPEYRKDSYRDWVRDYVVKPLRMEEE